MKMFVWDSIVLAQAATGHIIAVAETIEEARAIALERYAQQFLGLYGRLLDSGWKDALLKDLSADPKVTRLPCALFISGSA